MTILRYLRCLVNEIKAQLGGLPVAISRSACSALVDTYDMNDGNYSDSSACTLKRVFYNQNNTGSEHDYVRAAFYSPGIVRRV